MPRCGIHSNRKKSRHALGEGPERVREQEVRSVDAVSSPVPLADRCGGGASTRDDDCEDDNDDEEEDDD
jgi:hypothetical protein